MSRTDWLSNLCISEAKLVYKYVAKRQDYPLKNMGRTHDGLIYTVEGTETYHFTDKSLSAKPNSVLYIPKGEKYTIDLCDERSVVIAFDFEITETADMRPFCAKLEKDQGLRSDFADAELRWRSRKPEYLAECKAFFYKIVAALIKNETYYSNSRNLSRIAEAVAYLHAHYSESGFRVSALSEIAGMSPRYFETLFFREFKTTPKEYVVSLRLALAKELLLSERSSVSDVAYQLGYSDVYHFIKIFKARVGCTPGEYKRMSRL